MKRVYRKRDKTEKFKQKLRSGIEEGGVHKTAKSVSHEKVKSLARGVLQWWTKLTCPCAFKDWISNKWTVPLSDWRLCVGITNIRVGFSFKSRVHSQSQVWLVVNPENGLSSLVKVSANHRTCLELWEVQHGGKQLCFCLFVCLFISFTVCAFACF